MNEHSFWVWILIICSTSHQSRHSLIVRYNRLHLSCTNSQAVFKTPLISVSKFLSYYTNFIDGFLKSFRECKITIFVLLWSTLNSLSIKIHCILKVNSQFAGSRPCLRAWGATCSSLSSLALSLEEGDSGGDFQGFLSLRGPRGWSTSWLVHFFWLEVMVRELFSLVEGILMLGWGLNSEIDGFGGFEFCKNDDFKSAWSKYGGVHPGIRYIPGF